MVYVPSGNFQQFAIDNGHRDFVSFLMNNRDFPISVVSLPEGTYIWVMILASLVKRKLPYMEHTRLGIVL